MLFSKNRVYKFNSTLMYYSDWIKIYKKIEESGTFKDEYENLIHGKLNDIKFSKVHFTNETIEFINKILKILLNNYNSFLSKCFEIHDFDSLEYYTIQTKGEFNMIYFFNNLHFIDKDIIDKLNSEIKKNINEYFNTIHKYLYTHSYEDISLLEVDYMLKKYFKGE